MTETKRRFTVISNENYETDNDIKEQEREHKKREREYHTSPLKWQGQSLREDFMRFTNGEGGSRFTVEDLLKW